MSWAVWFYSERHSHWWLFPCTVHFHTHNRPLQHPPHALLVLDGFPGTCHLEWVGGLRKSEGNGQNWSQFALVGMESLMEEARQSKSISTSGWWDYLVPFFFSQQPPTYPSQVALWAEELCGCAVAVVLEFPSALQPAAFAPAQSVKSINAPPPGLGMVGPGN